MKHWPLVLLMSIPLAGCVLWSDFEPPETAAPQVWKGQSTQPDAQAAWPNADWWKQFNSAQLDSMMDSANQSNFDINAAVARIKQADAQARIAGASLLPQVNASAGAERDRTPGSSGSSLGLTNRKAHITNAYNAGLNASYELDFWGKNYAAAQSAEELANASRYDAQTVALTTSSAVATNYFDILATQERLKMAQQNLDDSERLLKTIQSRFAAGISSGLDLAQQENLTATERAVIPPLKQHLGQALDAQAILLGKMPEKLEMADEKLADLALPEVRAGLPSELLQHRPDVQEAEAQLAATHADIISARAAFFPSISLTAGGGYQSTALAMLFEPQSRFFSIGAALSQPIFDGGTLFGNLDLQKARYEEALQNYQKAAFMAFSDVEDALIAVQQTTDSEKDNQAAEAAARKAYELSQRQFKGGIIDITTVLNTERALFSAQDTLVQAKLAHLQAIVGLYKALGGGWDVHPPQTTDDAGVTL